MQVYICCIYLYKCVAKFHCCLVCHAASQQRHCFELLWRGGGLPRSMVNPCDRILGVQHLGNFKAVHSMHSTQGGGKEIIG